MRRNRALCSHAHHHMRTNLPNAPCQVGRHGVKILPIKLPVRIVQHRSLAYFQQLAGRLKFQQTRGRKLFVGLCAAPVCGRLAGRKADNVRFHALFRVAQQGAAKTAGFIVRMCSYT